MNLRRNIDAEGFPDVDIIYVGGLTVLLVFLDSQGVPKAMEDGLSNWNRWFETMKPWVGQPVKYSRIAWLIIRGIPTHLWDATIMDQIGSIFGKVILNP